MRKQIRGHWPTSQGEPVTTHHDPTMFISGVVMVAIGVSEFTYGFAFLFEQVNANLLGVSAAPVLPSLQTEQMSGWDVSIPLFGVPFFYQFKIPEYLSAAHATYISDETYDGSYYRIDLHRRGYNRQHRR